MGFFKNLFKKKKGGTTVGNFIRGVANSVSDGMFGNGTELAKWEAEQAKKDFERQLAETQEALANSSAYQSGRGTGAPTGQRVVNHLENSATAQQLQNNQAKAWFGRNWWKIAIPVVVLPLLIWGVIKLSKRKKLG